MDMNLTIHLIDFLHIDVCSPLEGLDVGRDVGLYDVGLGVGFGVGAFVMFASCARYWASRARTAFV